MVIPMNNNCKKYYQNTTALWTVTRDRFKYTSFQVGCHQKSNEISTVFVGILTSVCVRILFL